ncbi:hypothetical protein Hanom_Chr10g00927561 [Helianthus anomalus]
MVTDKDDVNKPSPLWFIGRRHLVVKIPGDSWDEDSTERRRKVRQRRMKVRRTKYAGRRVKLRKSILVNLIVHKSSGVLQENCLYLRFVRLLKKLIQ